MIDPLTLHNSGDDNLLDVKLGGIPKGDLGGISLGPLAGRRARHRPGRAVPDAGTASTFSLAIALSATILAMAFGTCMGIIARRDAAGSSTR